MHKFLEDAARAVRDAEEDWIPGNLQPFINQSATDVNFRTEYGEDLLTWELILQFLDQSGIEPTQKPPRAARFVNGVLLIARALVSTEKGAQLAWESNVGPRVVDLVKCLLGVDARTDRQERLLSTCFQFLANSSNHRAVGPELMQGLNDGQLANLGRELASNNQLYLLVIVASTVKRDASFVLNSGRPAFIHILSQVEVWHSTDKDDSIRVANDIFKSLIPIGSQLLESFKDVTRDQHLSMLKMLDAALSVSEVGDSRVPLAAVLIDELEKASSSAQPFITQFDMNPEYSQAIKLEIASIWNSLVIILDSLILLLEKSPQGALLTLDQRPKAIEVIVNFLVLAERNLPKKSKLSQIDSNAEYDPQEFPLIKGKLITLVSVFTHFIPHSVQDEVRRLHGLEVILSNCMIDQNNPYIREQSIVALRYLLEENAANQEFVSKLEAKENVTEDALHEVGYETEIINGKVTLKKRPKT
uniref:Ataxin-10 homolog n=1 Tax=Blastobotrys adeninivorans TaxID=409370 RepID=A0A060TFH4_BLAAD